LISAIYTEYRQSRFGEENIFSPDTLGGVLHVYNGGYLTHGGDPFTSESEAQENQSRKEKEECKEKKLQKRLPLKQFHER